MSKLEQSDQLQSPSGAGSDSALASSVFASNNANDWNVLKDRPTSSATVAVLTDFQLVRADGPAAVPGPVADRQPRGDGPAAPPAPEAPKPADAGTIMQNKLKIGDVPSELNGKYNRVFQQAITDSGHLKQEKVDSIYKAAGIKVMDHTPDSVKTQKLAEYFKMPQGSSRADVQKRLDEEVRSQLGIPANYNRMQEMDLLRQKSFLKKLGLPETADQNDQIEALRKLP